MWLLLMYGIYMVGIVIMNLLEFYYFIYILGDVLKFILLGLLNVIIGIFVVLVFLLLVKKFSCCKVFFLVVVIMMILLIMFVFVG